MLMQLKKRQGGFSLLEALLSIVIILAAGLGVVELFISGDKKNKINATQQIVEQVASAASQLMNTSYGVASGVATDDNIIASGLIPKTDINAKGDAIIGPYGPISVTQVDNIKYTVTASNVPVSEAKTMCGNMFSTAAVSTGATSTTYAGSVSYCNGSLFSSVKTARTTISFSYPIEDYTLTTTTTAA